MKESMMKGLRKINFFNYASSGKFNKIILQQKNYCEKGLRIIIDIKMIGSYIIMRLKRGNRTMGILLYVGLFVVL